MTDLVKDCDLLVHEATIGPVLEDIIPKEGLDRISTLKYFYDICRISRISRVQKQADID